MQRYIFKTSYSIAIEIGFIINYSIKIATFLAISKYKISFFIKIIN